MAQPDHTATAVAQDKHTSSEAEGTLKRIRRGRPEQSELFKRRIAARQPD